MLKMFQALRPGRGCTKFVACSDGPQLEKLFADLVLTGSSDQTAINALLTSMGAGTLMIGKGTVTCTGTITSSVAGQHIKGSGRSVTTIFAANNAGSNAPQVSLVHNSCSLSDLTLDGNKANNAGRTAMLNWSVSGAYCRIENVEAINSAGNGVSTSGSYVFILGGRVAAAAFVGVVLGSTLGGRIFGTLIESNLSHGLFISGDLNVAVGVQTLSNTSSGIHVTIGADYNEIIGCYSLSNGQYGLAIEAGATGNYIGPNHYGTGNTAGEINDLGTNTKRLAKRQLDYVANTDLLSAAAIAANTWTDVSANQTFRVDSISSVVEISSVGFMLMGNSGTVNTEMSARLVIDAAGTPINRKISGTTQQTATGLAGLPLVGTVRLTGLAVGNHTVKVQCFASLACTAYLRASSVAEIESLNLQVEERAAS